MNHLLDALDELTSVRLHLDLIEIVTRTSSDDEGKAINAVLWTALNRMETAVSLLDALLAEERQAINRK